MNNNNTILFYLFYKTQSILRYCYIREKSQEARARKQEIAIYPDSCVLALYSDLLLP